VGTPGGMKNIQMMMYLCPRVLKNVVGCRSRSIPHAGFLLLNIFVFDQVDDVLHTIHRKKCKGIKSGDLGGQTIGAPLPIHPARIV
jgi:hypothetical protein